MIGNRDEKHIHINDIKKGTYNYIFLKQMLYLLYNDDETSYNNMSIYISIFDMFVFIYMYWRGS